MQLSVTKKPMASPAALEEALEGVARGDREAFRTLYEQMAPAVLGFALSLLRSREDAEDAMQETFVKIHGAARLYTPAGKPAAWIMTIARNVCMSHFREQARRASLEETGREAPDSFDAIGDRENRLFHI